MLLGLIFLVIGIGLLTVADDKFVDGASAVAHRFEVSPIVVGALIIGFGTSLPEMLVSGLAAAQGDADLGVGNVVGSNVANLTLVLGLAALITTIAAAREVTRRELPLCAGSVLLFAVFVQNGFTRWEGIVLAVVLAATLAFLLQGAHDDDHDHDHAEDQPLGRMVVETVLGLIGTSISSGFDISMHDALIGLFAGAALLAIPGAFFNHATRVVPAPEVALLLMSEVLLAPLWVWVFVDEQPESTTLIGGAIVFAAVFGLLLWRRQLARQR